MSKIYTKTGDKGETSLLGGQRVLKDDLRVTAYGGVDELNSIIGLVCTYANEHLEFLHKIQSSLFDLGAALSCPVNKRDVFKIKGINKNLVLEMEVEMDKMSLELDELKSFILPGGHESSAHMHWVRTVVRRIERDLVSFFNKNEDEMDTEAVLIFINRLSDFFFVMARYYNKKNFKKDIAWLS